MKKGILLLLGMFLMVSTIEATHSNKLSIRNGFDYSYNNAVNFVERGIEFFVFTNGEFDFDTSFRNRGVRIQRDFKGRIRNVGNVFLNYDRFGNVSRIGNVFIRYHRGRLISVGNLRVHYNSWGEPVFRGNVNANFYYHNGVRFNVNFGDVCNYNDVYFFGREFRRNYSQIREDRDFYYYRANTNARVGKRSQILKRRKPATTNRRIPENTTRRNNYRKAENTTRREGKSISRKANTTSYKKPKAVVKRNEKNVTKHSLKREVNTKRTRRN